MIPNARCMTAMVRILCVLTLWVPAAAFGWGPHWHITRAAIDVLGTKHPLAAQLGAELLPLTNYCWLPDYKRIYGPYNSRITKMQQAFTVIMQDGVQVSLIQ